MSKLNYDERMAVKTLRASMRRNPQIAAQLLEGMSKEVAVAVLLQAKKEIELLLNISRTFSAAAGEIAKAEKEPS